jgi:hypothetical protein
MGYIMKVNYGWYGPPTLNRYWVIDDNNTFYKVKDSKDKVKELIDEINQSKDIEKVNINVYELGSKVTDKFI